MSKLNLILSNASSKTLQALMPPSKKSIGSSENWLSSPNKKCNTEQFKELK